MNVGELRCGFKVEVKIGFRTGSGGQLGWLGEFIKSRKVLTKIEVQ